GAKQGVDDFLAAGHTTEDLTHLIDAPRTELQPSLPYTVRDGRICRRKNTVEGELIIPLCNFTAEIVQEIARDNGEEVTRELAIIGQHANGYALPIAR